MVCSTPRSKAARNLRENHYSAGTHTLPAVYYPPHPPRRRPQLLGTLILTAVNREGLAVVGPVAVGLVEAVAVEAVVSNLPVVTVHGKPGAEHLK